MFLETVNCMCTYLKYKLQNPSKHVKLLAFCRVENVILEHAIYLRSCLMVDLKIIISSSTESAEHATFTLYTRFHKQVLKMCLYTLEAIAQTYMSISVKRLAHKLHLLFCFSFFRIMLVVFTIYSLQYFTWTPIN